MHACIVLDSFLTTIVILGLTVVCIIGNRYSTSLKTKEIASSIGMGKILCMRFPYHQTDNLHFSCFIAQNSLLFILHMAWDTIFNICMCYPGVLRGK